MLKLRSLLAAFAGAWVMVLAPSYAGGLPDDRANLIFEKDWIAASTTAMGVTGDVWLTPTSVTFDDRVSFRLRYLSDVTVAKPLSGWGEMREFSLFEILDPQPQEILNGSHLCGWPRFNPSVPLPRYLAVAFKRRGDRDELLILVFATSTPPNITEGQGLCGEFGYSAERPAPSDQKPARKRRV